MKQFSIRDLLIATAVVALALGWWIDRQNSALPTARYEIRVVQGRAFVLDTATGQVWEKFFHESGGSTSPDFLQPKTNANP